MGRRITGWYWVKLCGKWFVSFWSTEDSCWMDYNDYYDDSKWDEINENRILNPDETDAKLMKTHENPERT